jgi:hypothetical protein
MCHVPHMPVTAKERQMNKEEVDSLSETEVYAQSIDIARNLGGDNAVRRLTVMTVDQMRNFLLRNG